MNGDPGGQRGREGGRETEAGDPRSQGTPGPFIGLGVKEIWGEKFPRGAWPPFSVVPGAETFH